jgi:ectoine hydroxylase-related dioxygenase (phytanoyl-CoA dioxygenase family)
MGANSDDPQTWYKKPGTYGIMLQFFHHPALAANRRSQRIHKAFAQIWGTADLWMTVDRVSFNPPQRDDWHFPGPHLHWDTHLEPPIPFSVSGLLYLTDTSADQGAFRCVPGFHRRIADWIESLPAGTDPRSQDLEQLGAIPIAGRAGDLIIWHKSLPHGSGPNQTTRPRIAQYIAMYPTNI